MARFSLSRHDTQAKVGAMISLASCVGLAALAFLVLRHIDWGQWVITYGKTRFQLTLVVGAITILMAAIGFGMGWSSAGQRRNDKQSLSWIGFFVGAAVISLAVILLFVIYMRGEQVIT